MTTQEIAVNDAPAAPVLHASVPMLTSARLVATAEHGLTTGLVSWSVNLHAPEQEAPLASARAFTWSLDPVRQAPAFVEACTNVSAEAGWIASALDEHGWTAFRSSCPVTILEHVEVHPAHRGRGLARLTVAGLLGHAHGRDERRGVIAALAGAIESTSEDRARSRRLLAGLGFTPLDGIIWAVDPTSADYLSPAEVLAGYRLS
jgi:GNAT superfamily N-acetyltransferase